MDEAPAAFGAGSNGAVGAPAADGIVEPGTTGEADPGANADESTVPLHVEHVPIKRKGSRKR
jgi:ribonuclease E